MNTHESAGAVLGTPKPGKLPKPKARKKFSAEQLHDGTYGTMKHGEGEPQMGSAKNLYQVHEQMEDHFGDGGGEEEEA